MITTVRKTVRGNVWSKILNCLYGRLISFNQELATELVNTHTDISWTWSLIYEMKTNKLQTSRFRCLIPWFPESAALQWSSLFTEGGVNYTGISRFSSGNQKSLSMVSRFNHDSTITVNLCGQFPLLQRGSDNDLALKTSSRWPLSWGSVCRSRGPGDL